MKTLISMVCCAVAGVSGAHAMGVSWGSALFSDFRDSYGNSLDETFIVQLGFFEDVLGNPFVPDANNVADWATRWKVFDQASLNLGDGYFSSEARVTEEGTSTSPAATLGVNNFTGQQAYVWIRNASAPEPGTEWFLASAPQWVFPQGSDECCDTSLPLQWSISDLNPEGGEAVTPVWGGQSGSSGSGEYTTTSSNYTLQTFTFVPVAVPEPTAILLSLSGSLLLLRRQRPAL